MVSPGSVQIRMRPQGRSNYDFYEIKFDDLGGYGTGFAKIRNSFSDLLLAKAFAISKPQLKKIGAAMAVAGNQEFAQLAPFILRLTGTPTSPTSHTTLRFNRVDALDTDADSRFRLDIVPSTRGGTALKRARMQSDILIWTKLSEAYWESRGQEGLLHEDR